MCLSLSIYIYIYAYMPLNKKRCHKNKGLTHFSKMTVSIIRSVEAVDAMITHWFANLAKKTCSCERKQRRKCSSRGPSSEIRNSQQHDREGPQPQVTTPSVNVCFETTISYQRKHPVLGGLPSIPVEGEGKQPEGPLNLQRVHRDPCRRCRPTFQESVQRSSPPHAKGQTKLRRSGGSSTEKWQVPETRSSATAC